MPDEPDMIAPVTRGEMHQALETWAKVLMDHAQKTAEAIAAKLSDQMRRLQAETHAEIGRATKASAEELELRLQPMWLAAVDVAHGQSKDALLAVDEQYKTLPGRVEKLEDAVFKPKPKRRAKG